MAGMRHQVIIVGGGPVGVALAVQLGRRGIRCALIESRTEIGRIPKGQNLTQRTLEHFYFMGIVDELRAARFLPPEFAIGEITSYRTLNSPYWHAPAGRELVQDYYFQKNDRLPQYQMEKVLRAKMATLPQVEARFGWTATEIEQAAGGVRVTIENDGAREVLEAAYAVGCDGGHSIVREQIGITRSGRDFDQLMVLIVLRSRDLHDKLGQRFPEKSIYRAMHPDLKGYWRFFGRIDVGEGFFFHAPVPRDTTRDNFDFQALLEEATGFPFKAEFDHLGFWDLRVAVAERYQVGRVFIAGDAAHSHPPYGGFGLNNGLEDAVNLGWKLAARLDGWGGDVLLQSYSDERRPIFTEVAEDFIAARIRNDGAFLARYSPERDKAEFEAAWKNQESDVGNRAQVYEPSYEGSPVVIGPPGGRSTAHGKHVFFARAGHHLVPQALSSGRNVFEELGRGFTLLAFGVDDAQVRAFEQAASALGVPLKVLCDSYADGRLKYETRMILIRPDQFIAWIGDRAPPDARAVMQRVSGRD
jgi:2-polyprenyl-6-methoxyphenol hydroxylase-like FAD-dependent oxidoreductase